VKRTFTLFAFIVCALVSLAFYRLAYEVQQLENRLAETNRGIMIEHNAIDVLRAEWAYLVRPDMLQERAARHLNLAPIAAHQVIDGQHLPDNVVWPKRAGSRDNRASRSSADAGNLAAEAGDTMAGNR
jgi:hypothetical protein